MSFSIHFVTTIESTVYYISYYAYIRVLTFNGLGLQQSHIQQFLSAHSLGAIHQL